MADRDLQGIPVDNGPRGSIGIVSVDTTSRAASIDESPSSPPSDHSVPTDVDSSTEASFLTSPNGQPGQSASPDLSQETPDTLEDIGSIEPQPSPLDDVFQEGEQESVQTDHQEQDSLIDDSDVDEQIADHGADVPEELESQADLEDGQESGSSEDTSTTYVDPYSLEEGAGVNLLTFQNLLDSVSWEPTAEYTLPVGSDVKADCSLRAAVLQANPGKIPFTVIGCLEFGTGEYTVVLEEPFSGSGYAPSEAHVTESMLVWVETNNATDEWALYGCPFLGAPIDTVATSAVKLDSGDVQWLPPQIAVSGATVVWQKMPDPSGPFVRDSSHLYKWTLGSGEAEDFVTSPGRFGCPPDINRGVLTIAPRVNADQGVYYGITALDLSDGTQIDQTVLPVSVRPFRATRIGDEFAFSIEANYGYGGLLGKMGYYFGSSDGPWDYIAREPSAQISFVGGHYIVRSQLAYFVIDPRGWFSQINAAEGCVDYGDYPASSGSTDMFVTYAKVKNESTGIPDSVVVRTFTVL